MLRARIPATLRPSCSRINVLKVRLTVTTLLDSPKFSDIAGELAGKELELDVLGVKRTASLPSETSPNRLDPVNSAAKFETLDPNRRLSTLTCREDGPHVRAQGVHRGLEVLQPRREHGGTSKTGVDIVE